MYKKNSVEGSRSLKRWDEMEGESWFFRVMKNGNLKHKNVIIDWLYLLLYDKLCMA